MFEQIDGWSVKIEADTTQLQKDLKGMSDLGESFGRKLTGAFVDVAVKGKDLSSVFRSLALSLSRGVVNKAFQPIQQAAGGLFGNLFSGGGAGAGGGLADITPFARGGVISSPALFPLGRNGTGLAGEAGAEAILPLARGSDGRLGVKADDGTGRQINITFHVTATDAESFRQSESQITALLNRAVARGARNL